MEEVSFFASRIPPLVFNGEAHRSYFTPLRRLARVFFSRACGDRNKFRAFIKLLVIAT